MSPVSSCRHRAGSSRKHEKCLWRLHPGAPAPRMFVPRYQRAKPAARDPRDKRQTNGVLKTIMKTLSVARECARRISGKVRRTLHFALTTGARTGRRARLPAEGEERKPRVSAQQDEVDRDSYR